MDIQLQIEKMENKHGPLSINNSEQTGKDTERGINSAGTKIKAKKKGLFQSTSVVLSREVSQEKKVKKKLDKSMSLQPSPFASFLESKQQSKDGWAVENAVDEEALNEVTYQSPT